MMKYSSSTVAGASGRPRTALRRTRSPLHSLTPSPPDQGPAGGRKPKRSLARAPPSFSMRATRVSTPVPWRGERQGRGTCRELRTSTPIASWIPTAVPSALRRSWSGGDRKSTRLNSSHANISYAVFCLKKKKINDDCQVAPDIEETRNVEKDRTHYVQSVDIVDLEEHV